MTAAPEEHGTTDQDPLDVLDRLPPKLKAIALPLVSRWPGRVALTSAHTFRRIEIFDRSMTIAAQFFTSVFPLLILMALAFTSADSDRLEAWLSVPDDSQDVIQDAVQGDASTTIGVLGLIIVLASGTSLSRALTRAFASIWELPRPRSTIRAAWRWLVVLTTLALFLVVAPALQHITRDLPPPETLWHLASIIAVYMLVAAFVPWLLLAGAVRMRVLVPGALIFTTALLVIRPAARIYLPRALESSAAHYGSIGVAFTYIGYLYVVSFVYLGCAAFGQVLVTDPGGFGRWLRGEVSLRDKVRQAPTAMADRRKGRR